MTAVQAKKLKIPIIVSDIDGHKDCMRNFANRLSDYEDIGEKLRLVCTDNCISYNYKDSNERETLEQFINSMKKIYKEKMS